MCAAWKSIFDSLIIVFLSAKFTTRVSSRVPCTEFAAAHMRVPSWVYAIRCGLLSLRPPPVSLYGGGHPATSRLAGVVRADPSALDRLARRLVAALVVLDARRAEEHAVLVARLVLQQALRRGGDAGRHVGGARRRCQREGRTVILSIRAGWARKARGCRERPSSALAGDRCTTACRLRP